MKIRGKFGQQEIVGFVLIVVVVVVALMVFLIISVRDSADEETSSLEISNMLDVIMRTTSECAIVYEPDYDDYEELFKSCYSNDECSNLGISACDYLNESFMEIVETLSASESGLNGYRIEFYVKDGEGLMSWDKGNCSSFSSGAQSTIISRSDSLIVRVRVCNVI